MIDKKTCDWLMDNADAPVRYRVARELLKDEKAAKNIEPELLENPAVKLWLKNLKPEKPPQHWSMAHGSFDYCLENAMSKAVRLGLHGGLPQVIDAASYYLSFMKENYPKRHFRNKERTGFFTIITANFLNLAGVEDETTLRFMRGSLDELYDFVRQSNYDIYITEEERAELKGVPPNWGERMDFIKPELLSERGFCFPYIYDIIGLHRLYELRDTDVTMKVDAVLRYITCDEFHEEISDGYGILIAGKNVYHGMGWSPHYPGWFDVTNYMENGNMPRLLFYAEHFAKYPIAINTEWYNKLLHCLESCKTQNNTYQFPREWLPEKRGYAVCGGHMSFGENRRKKNWREIESTFYMQLLQQFQRRN